MVDDQQIARELLSIAIGSQLRVPTIMAKSGEEAISLLKSDPNITGVISDYNMPNGTGGDLFKYLSQTTPSLPFVLCTSSKLAELPEFAGKKIAGYVSKPVDWEKLVEVIKTGILATAPRQDRVTSQDEYFPVGLKTLVRIGVLQSDIYIKLTDEKYVMLLKKGDAFTNLDLKTYSERKVDSFYIKLKDCTSFLNELSSELKALSAATDLPWNEACEVLESAYDSVSQTIQRFGFTLEVQELARAGARLAIKTIVSAPNLAEFFAHVDTSHFRFTHSLLLSQVSCAMASAMGWTSDSTQYKLALASFLHDISISDEIAMFELKFDPHAKYQGTEGEMASKFRKHPSDVADLLDHVRGVPRDVGDIVMGHHERPDGSGIPLGLSFEKLSPLASLFIVAHDLVLFIWSGMQSGTPAVAPFEAFLAVHRLDYSGVHFTKVLNALSALQPKG